MARSPLGVWELGYSERYHRYFYQNRWTGKSQWEKPLHCTVDSTPKNEKLNAQELPKILASRRRLKPDVKFEEELPAGWEAHFDEDNGKWYFSEKSSGMRTWFKPVMPSWLLEQPHQPHQQVEKHHAEKAKYEGYFEKQHLLDLLNKRYDPQNFLRELEKAKDDDVLFKNKLKEVKSINDQLILVKDMPIPTTVPVTYQECIDALLDGQVQGYREKPSISISRRTVAQAMDFYSSDRKRVVCGVNSAEGRKAYSGLGYKQGVLGAGEEDLFRRFSNLYESLQRAAGAGHYDFGPSTCLNEAEPEKYCDVLLTPSTSDKDGARTDGLMLTRGEIGKGFPIMTDAECRRCCLVSAAPPVVNRLTSSNGKVDIVDRRLLFQLMVTMFVAPVLKEICCTTLVIGAWGCGKEGNDPAQIAELFAEVIQCKPPELEFELGSLYHEIHFAIPAETPDDELYTVFCEVFDKKNLKAERLSDLI